MLVSVLINNFNYGDYLEECIESVLRQTYDQIEIIVYDDGSTDHSREVLSKYNIKTIFAENYKKTPNLNQMNAINKAFELAKGEIVCLLDSDDYFRADKIEKIVAAFKAQPEINVIQHPLLEVNKEGDSLESVVPVLKKVTQHKEYIYTTGNLFHLFVMTSGISFKQDFLAKLLPLAEDALDLICVDTRLLQLSALHGTIVTLEEPLTFYRKHGSNTWSKLGDWQVHEQYTKQLYQFFNQNAKRAYLPEIHYSEEIFYKNTFFAKALDVEKCKVFLNEQSYFIWGAGEAGQSIAYILENREGFKGFIDSDIKKQGQIFFGQQVISFEQLILTSDIKILISPYHAYEPIKALLEKHNLHEGIHFIDPYNEKKDLT